MGLRLSALRTMPVAFLYLLSSQMWNYDAGICKDGWIILDCDFLYDRRWARRYMEYLRYGWKVLPKKESGNYTIYTKMFFFVDTGLYEAYNKKAYKRKIDGGI